jgi:hypothetical protein
LQVNPFEDQSQLGRFQTARARFVFSERQLEATLLDALRPHCDAIAIPLHDSHSVPAAREEDEEVPAEHVLLKRIAHQHHQAVSAFSPIHRPDGDE